MSTTSLNTHIQVSNIDQPDTRKLVPVYHRYRTEWVREGDLVAFTPGCGLDEANAHLFPESKSEHSDELLPLRPLKRHEENANWEAACVKVTDDTEKTAAKKNEK